jgi:hypothetical protein
MQKQTLKFDCLVNMALFSKMVATGYLMNTNNLTLTGKFTHSEVELAQKRFRAAMVETSEKVFSYEAEL